MEYYTYLLVYFFIFLFVVKISGFDKDDILLIVRIYFFLTIISMLLVFHHNFYFNMPFDSYGDDARYYNWAIDNSKNIFIPSYSIYEKFLGCILIIFNWIGIKNNLYMLLPINVIVTTLCVIYSYKVSILVTNLKIKEFWIWLSIIFNYTFLNNAIHLYRDIYIALFSILFIYWWLQSELKIRYIFLLCFFRLPNALIIILSYLIDKLATKNKKYIIYSISGLLGLVIISFFSIKFGIKVGTKYDLATAPSMVLNHIEHFRNAAIEAGGLMSMLHQLPFIIKLFINNFIQVIRPLSINPFFNTFDYSNITDVLDHRAIGWAITTLSLSLVAGRYLSAIVILINKFNDEKIRKVAVYFFIMTFVIGFLSFLDRHRMYIIIIYPTLIALSIKYEGKYMYNNKLFYIGIGSVFFSVSVYGILNQIL
ncbi:TPA: hypothetical protein ACX6Q6_003705 [Photobacterium damselae]